MTTDRTDEESLEILDFRVQMLLPEDYQDSYESLRPTPMGAAGLKFDDQGRVAWDEIWGSFCDLAIAGGPPHKGTWLAPGTTTAIATADEGYRTVVAEICRGITMVTGLGASDSDVPGWVRVECLDDVMADWLLRAIVVENVAVRADGRDLFLPAAPLFRLEKEIKNVVTVIAKTCHYWLGHMPGIQRAAIGRLFAEVSDEAPLITPRWPLTDDDLGRAARLRAEIDRRIHRLTGRGRSGHDYPGWLGVECPNVASAVWIMRALVVHNVLSRREGGAVFVPVDPYADPDGSLVSETFALVHRLAGRRGVL